jgi:hypothetical protein
VNNTKVDAEQSGVFAISNATIFFQALMMVTAVYYGMLCTNWGELYLYVGVTTTTDNTAFWMKLVAQWITMSLYIFSLVAPLLFPDREFG